MQKPSSLLIRSSIFQKGFDKVLKTVIALSAENAESHHILLFDQNDV